MNKFVDVSATWLSKMMLAIVLAQLAALLTPAWAAPTVTTSTTLTPAATTVQVGVPVLLTASVTGTAPTGTVTFKRGTTTLGTGALSGSGNSRTATYLATFSTVASNSLTAVYGADAVNKASTSTAKTVSSTKSTTTTSLASNLNPSTLGASVTFTATVTGFTPSGTVTFKDGTTTLGTGTLSGTGNTRTATYAKSNMTVASHAITAVYAGDTLNLTSTASVLSQVVNAATVASTTTLTSSANPASAGANVTLTATVAGSAPTGTVTFKDAATTLGTGTLSGSGNSRTASFSTTTLAAGSHNLTAVYGGNTGNAGSTSAVLIQTVNTVLVASTTSLSVTPNPANAGTNVALTAVIVGSNPGGTVSFSDGGTVLGTATVTSGVASLTSARLAAGSHNLSAAYLGDSANLASTSTVVLLNVNAGGAGAMTYQYGYDAMGRLTTAIDPNGLATYTFYDSLGRAVQVQQPANIGSATPTTTDLAYSLADSLTSVIDPRNLTTSYSPNGLGQVTAQTSPDSGNAQYTYDAKGNMLSATDARGKVTTMAYDALDRLTSVSYPTGVATLLEYDGGPVPTPAATGELTKMTDESGSTTYTYDALGRLTGKTQIISGKTFTVGYTWGDSGTALDKLTAVTYPSGSRVNYSYDLYGALAGVSVNPVNANGVGVSGSSQILLSGLSYNADNNITGWTWSNGLVRSMGYDNFGQIAGYSLGDPNGTGLSSGAYRLLTRDPGGRISAYTHTRSGTSVSALNQYFAYDNLNRLLDATQGGGSAVLYSYDDNGNRSSRSVGANTYINTIDTTSNRLLQTQDLGGTATQTFDAAGHVTGDGSNTFAYSDRGRMRSATNSTGTVSYLYNGMNLRAAKTGPTSLVTTGAAYFVYDEAGQLLGEYSATGAPIYETIYLNAIPVGLMKQTGTPASANITTGIYNVYADHLATPRMVTRQSDQAIVWRWDTAEAFGASPSNDNPSGLGVFTFNQRFAGQVFDAETGLFDNWNRTYDARQGRYRQSDPIGLAGGINTYAYTGSNPLSYIDPEGLWSVTFGGYAGPGFQITAGNANGNGFLTVRVGLGAGGGFSYNPKGGLPGEAPIDPSKGGVVAACSAKASFNAGPLQTGAEVGGARNYNNGTSSLISPFSANGRFSNGWLGGGSIWNMNANANVGAQITIYNGH
jgi:RHS repeat-associated protein